MGADLQRPETRRLLEGVSGKCGTQPGSKETQVKLDRPSIPLNSDPAFCGLQQERVMRVSKDRSQMGHLTRQTCCMPEVRLNRSAKAYYFRRKAALERYQTGPTACKKMRAVTGPICLNSCSLQESSLGVLA